MSQQTVSVENQADKLKQTGADSEITFSYTHLR
jgi:hypothetical protein